MASKKNNNKKKKDGLSKTKTGACPSPKKEGVIGVEVHTLSGLVQSLWHLSEDLLDALLPPPLPQHLFLFSVVLLCFGAGRGQVM
jgi:hypothetical protein